ncbi:MAG: hypothetical protein K8R46_06400 [Pirellulales bacterium]|nr:hypothetical protein [Pirellulales bacterium]
MKTGYDMKKEWPKIKKELVRVSREALELAKKGEEELIKITQKGKLHVDTTELNLKKEHLFLRHGKEFVKDKTEGPQTPKMKQHLKSLDKLEKEITATKKKLAEKPKKKAAKKKRSTKA